MDYILFQHASMLGFRIQTIEKVPIKRILTEASYTFKGEESKGKETIMRYLTVEEYPKEADNASDLVYATISPVLCGFMRKTGRRGL